MTDTTVGVVAATAMGSAVANSVLVATAISQAEVPFNAKAIALFVQLFNGFTTFVLQTLGIIRRTRKTLGVVVDAVTGNSVSSAFVVLFSSSGNLKSTFTNKDGRFSFDSIKPDNYQLRVEHENYRFPSSILTVPENEAYTNIYHGEPIPFTKEEVSSNIAIPVDPEKVHLSPLQIFSLRTKSVLSFIFVRNYYPLAIIFLAVAVYAYIFAPSLFHFVILIITAASLVLNLLHDIFSPRKYGVVTDANGNPLSFIPVNLYTKGTFQKKQELYSATMTDKKGRFIFAPEYGSYILSVIKDNFRFEKEILIDEKHLWVKEKIFVK